MSCMWVNIAQVNNFLVQRWHREIKTTLYRLFSCKNMSVRPAQHWTSIFFVCAILSQTYLDNIEQTILQCNVIPVWSIQHFMDYFLHKSCLLVMGQYYSGKNYVQCCPKDSRQQCTGKNPVQCCLSILGTTLHRSKPYAMLSLRLQTTMHNSVQ